MEFVRRRWQQDPSQRLLVMRRRHGPPPPEIEQRAVAGTGIFSLKYEIDRMNGDLYLVGRRSLWDAAVEAELRRYRLDNKSRKLTQSYKPKQMCKEQLRLGALEALRRCRDEEEGIDGLNYVLVARNCRKVPSTEMERLALTETRIKKLWYALMVEGDLLIAKFASDIVQGDAVAPFVSSCFLFSSQYGMDNPIFTAGSDGTRVLISGAKVAADSVIQRTFPLKDGHSNYEHH